jgi:hypothetical protein
MPRSSRVQRVAGMATATMLLLGFAYSGAMSVRAYLTVFSEPPVSGTDATVDKNLGVVDLASGDELRAAVTAADWNASEDVVVLASCSPLSRTELTQLYYSASYLLYPRRVWLTSAPPRTRHALVVGKLDPTGTSRSHPVSSLLRLVDLP